MPTGKPSGSQSCPTPWPEQSPQQLADIADLAQALIQSRFSVSPKRLAPPGPSAAQLQAMIECAGCAPDHELLRPWRLIHIAPGQRAALAEVFARALRERRPDADEPALAQARAKAFRAPELLLAVVKLTPEHDNVPAAERHVALGAALMNLLLAAHGQGFAAMLTSGHALRTRSFAQAFALAGTEQALCFVSLGTASLVRRRPRPSAHELVSGWAAPQAAQPHAEPDRQACAQDMHTVKTGGHDQSRRPTDEG